MPGVQRQGDPNATGGIIVFGDPSVRINGRPIAVKGSPVSLHPVGNKRVTAVTTGTSSIRVNGRSVTLAGNSDTSGIARTGGSPDVTAT